MRRNLSDISIGDTASMEKIMTSDDIQKYAEISGDYNPIHFNSRYVNKYFRGGGCIAHGLFGLGMISQIVGMDMPGEGSIFLNENIDYTAPIYEDDKILASVTVVEIMEEKRLLTLDVLCVNQNDVPVMKGSVVVKLLADVDECLKLRTIKESDLEMIMEWRMRPEVTRYMYSDPVLTLEKQKEWYDRNQQDHTFKHWIINYSDTDIGYLSIGKIDTVHQRCEWAYYIADTSFRGKGIAKTLECNIYDYVFHTLGLNKLCCEVFTFNDSVIKLHERFGSEVEGIRKEHIIKNSQKYDIAVMGMYKRKWDAIRKEFEYDSILIE